MNAWLETSGGLRVPLHGVCSIGRAATNTLVVDDHRVSRRHAMIHAHSANIHQLVDLGSSNGVVLNGHAIKQPVALKDGDQIQIADSLLTFRCKSLSGAEPATADQTIFMSSGRLPRKQLWLMAAELDRPARNSPQKPVDPALAGQWLLGIKELLEKSGGLVYRFSGSGCVGFWMNPEAQLGDVAEAAAAFAANQLGDGPVFHFVIHRGEVEMDLTQAENDPVLIGNGMTVLNRMERWAAAQNQPAVLSAEAASALAGLLKLRSLGTHPLPGSTSGQELFAWTGD